MTVWAMVIPAATLAASRIRFLEDSVAAAVDVFLEVPSADSSAVYLAVPSEKILPSAVTLAVFSAVAAVLSAADSAVVFPEVPFPSAVLSGFLDFDIHLELVGSC